MAKKAFKQQGWGDKERSRKGVRKANHEIKVRKRLTSSGANIISKVEPVATAATQAELDLKGPVFYRCLSDPGDVKQRNPGEGVPYCRYCGFPMVRVGAVGREKRDRM